MSADLDAHACAALLHRSYSWFQRNWRAMRHEGTGALFPRPFVGGAKGSRPWWRRADVEAWKDGHAQGAASTPVYSTQREAPPANDPIQRPPRDRAQALRAAAGG